MKRSYPVRTIAFAGLLAVSMVLVAAGGKRLLVGNDEVSASIDSAYQCGQVAPVIIESGDPDVFGSGSARMQSMVDSVQAVIRHECEDLDRIDITGYLRGLGQSVYAGHAKWQDRWQVKDERTLRMQAPTPVDPGVDPEPSNRVLSLALNRLDMTVSKVQSNILEEFGAEPDYDPAVGLMQLELGGCPRGYPARDSEAIPRPPWACVSAAFTDRRIPTLYHFAYTQVVEGSVAEARGALVEHFGQPQAVQPGAVDGDERLVWTVTAATGVVSEMLEASLSRSGDNVVVHITLQDPGLAGVTPPQPDDEASATEFRLKL